jgi:hypothetical protein
MKSAIEYAVLATLSIAWGWTVFGDAGHTLVATLQTVADALAR